MTHPRLAVPDARASELAASGTTPTTMTRALLACGAVASPLFVTASLIQAATRGGFDLRRRPFSLLSLGEGGWIHVTSFVVSGLLFIACTVGMRQALHPGPGGTWGPVFIGGVGVGLIGGGVFIADPALGFPAGAPAGTPEILSWHGMVHGLAFAVGIGSLVAAMVLFARRFARFGQRTWAAYTLVTSVALVVLSAVGMVSGDFRVVTAAVVLGWTWMSLLAAWLATEPVHRDVPVHRAVGRES